jgi:hypothetical protein
MALSDIVEVVLEFVDIANSWRFYLPTIAGVLAAWGLVEWLGPSTMSFVLAGIVAMLGIYVGLVWQRRHGTG